MAKIAQTTVLRCNPRSLVEQGFQRFLGRYLLGLKALKFDPSRSLAGQQTGFGFEWG
jgi:hypothetical protein